MPNLNQSELLTVKFKCPQHKAKIHKTFVFNWNSLHARLNRQYEAWSYKKNKHKKIRAQRKSVLKEPTVKRCLSILDLKPLRS